MMIIFSQGHNIKVTTVPSWPYIALETDMRTGNLKMKGMFAEIWFELQVTYVTYLQIFLE